MIPKILIPSRFRPILILLVILICLTGCASHKNINRLARELDCNKTIHFIWDEAGNSVKIDRQGTVLGDSPYPNYRKTFRESIEEINKHTSATLLYKESPGVPSDSVILVKVLGKDITWKWGLSSALMETELQYQLDDQKVNITGKNKVYLAGTKTGNLYKSLKEGHYQFLKYLCE